MLAGAVENTGASTSPFNRIGMWTVVMRRAISVYLFLATQYGQRDVVFDGKYTYQHDEHEGDDY